VVLHGDGTEIELLVSPHGDVEKVCLMEKQKSVADENCKWIHITMVVAERLFGTD